MAYVAPNTFSNGTKIVAAQVEQNIDALHSYVNGGGNGSDWGNDWVKINHVMKGEYFPIINRYDMNTGISGGTLGSNEASGVGGKILGGITGAAETVPGTGYTFYLEEDADVFVQIHCFPRFYDGTDLAEIGLNGQRNFATIVINGDAKAQTRNDFGTEGEFGGGNGASNDGGIIGLERRRPYYGIYSEFLTAGEHKYQLRVGSNERSVPIFFYQINVYAYYRSTTS